jgi:hypothetical protein
VLLSKTFSYAILQTETGKEHIIKLFFAKNKRVQPFSKGTILNPVDLVLLDNY